MSDITNKIKERIIKLYKLTSQGVGGEQSNAKNILDKLLTKHGIDLSEIIDDTHEKWFSINFKSKFEMRLIIQIVARVKNKSEIKGYKDKNKFNIKASEIEFAEILTMYSIYRNALASEFEHIYIAFIHKQRIFSDGDTKRDGDEQEQPQTIEERARLRKIASMMESMDRVNVNKAIEN